MAADDASGRERRIYAAYESKDRKAVEDLRFEGSKLVKVEVEVEVYFGSLPNQEK